MAAASPKKDEKEAASPPPLKEDKHLPHEKHAYSVSALGRQSQSQRETIPTHKISNVGRHHLDGVYISEAHTRVAKVGRESPIGGPIYNKNNKGTLGGVSFGFGTAKRDITTLKRTSTNVFRPGEFITPVPEHPDDMPSNDALGTMPDAQKYKYHRDTCSIMGTEPRGQLKDAFLLKSHPVAFYATESPGPAAVGGEFGPKHEVCKKQLAPARKFGIKTHHKGTDWMRFGDNPDDIGPGRHERKDCAMHQQHLSHRRNLPVNKFTQAPKFERTRSQDTVSSLDCAKSSLGRQTLAKNRSEPCINFSADNRATRAKSMLCMTKQDLGPVASMPKFRAVQPPLPMEKHVMRSGFG